MNNKGFTLVEVISVVVIMAILMIVAVPSVIGISKNIKDNLYCNKTKSLEAAAKLYGKDFIDEIESTGMLTVSIKDLVDNNFYKKEVKDCSLDSNATNPCVADPRDNSNMIDDTITLTLKDKEIRSFFNYEGTDRELCEGKTKSEQKGIYTIFYDNYRATTLGDVQKDVTFSDPIPNLTKIPERKYIFKLNKLRDGDYINKTVQYKFLGYYTAKDWKTKYYDENGRGIGNYTLGKDIYLNANWQVVNETFPSVTRTGYNFKGWRNSDGSVYLANQSIELTKNISASAIWEAQQYDVKLDPGAGASGGIIIKATFEKDMPSIASNIPVKTGYIFDGYFAQTNGRGTKYYNANGTSKNIWNVPNNATLYAKWIAKSYDIRLISDTATTHGTSVVSVNYDASLPNITIPTKNYTVTFNYNGSGQANSSRSINVPFKGYFTSVNGRGTPYYGANGKGVRKWTTDGSINLYAAWDNAGAITLPTPNSRIGYSFKYWSTNASGTTIAGYAGSIYNPTGDITLYAIWNKDSYDIKLDNYYANNPGTQNVSVKYNESLPNISIPSRYLTVEFVYNNGQANTSQTAYYTFNGYFTSVNGRGDQYYSSGGQGVRNWDKNYGTTLYASWSGPGITLPTPSSKTGYKFKGWSTNSSGTSIVGTGGSIYNPTGSMTLYAIWESENYTIFFNDVGATVPGYSMTTARYGQPLADTKVPQKTYSITLDYNGSGQANEVRNAYCLFQGYYSSVNGLGIQYYNSVGQGVRNWDRTSGAFLYAYWTNCSINLPGASRDGYTFDGWFTTPSGSGFSGYANSIYNANSNITLYAHWTQSQQAKVDEMIKKYWYGSGHESTVQDAQIGANYFHDRGYTAVVNGTSISYWDDTVFDINKLRVAGTKTRSTRGGDINYYDNTNVAFSYIYPKEGLVGFDYRGATMYVPAGETVKFVLSFQLDTPSNLVPYMISDELVSIDLYMEGAGKVVAHWQRNENAKEIYSDVVSWTNNTGAGQYIQPNGHMQLVNTSSDVVAIGIYTWCLK